MSNEKPALADQMNLFSTKYQEIQAARAVLAQLEGQASEIGDQIVKAHGKGGHTMIVPDRQNPGKRRALVVTFQRVAKAVRFDATDVTDLVADLNPQPPPAPVATDPAERIAAATA